MAVLGETSPFTFDENLKDDLTLPQRIYLQSNNFNTMKTNCARKNLEEIALTNKSKEKVTEALKSFEHLQSSYTDPLSMMIAIA